MPRAFCHSLIRFTLKHAAGTRVVVKESHLPELLRDLREHRLDVVMTDVHVHGADEDAFDSELVGRVPIVFAATKAVAKRVGPLPKGLEAVPMVIPAHPSRIFAQVMDRLAQWKIKPRIAAEVQDVELARRLALDGLGVAPLNAHTVAASLPKGGLVAVPGSEKLGMVESVYLVTRPRKRIHPITADLIKRFRFGS